MRKPLEWEEADVQSLVDDGVEEDHELDYKACASLFPSPNPQKNYKEEIGIDVASFANAAGGTILYGIKEKSRGIPENIDDGFDPDKIRKEWLEQVIRSNVQPPVDDVHVKPIPLGGSRSGKVLYLVAVPRGTKAHQSKDGRYWRRDGSGKRYLHDDEIQDLMRRGEAPDLHLDIWLKDGPEVRLQFTDGEEWSRPVELLTSLVNEGTTPAEYVYAEVHYSHDLQVMYEDREAHLAGQKRVQVADHTELMHAIGVTRGVPGKLPVWKGRPWALLTTPLQIRLRQGRPIFTIGWEVHSPGMLPRSCYYALRVYGGVLSLHPWTAGS